MRAINIEDKVLKHTSIKRVLSNLKYEVTWKKTLTDGIEEIKQASAKGRPYDLLVLDMHFPITKDDYDRKAGEKVIAILEEEHIKLPTIVCSSVHYDIPQIVGCVFYNEKRSWEMELSKLIKSID